MTAYSGSGSPSDCTRSCSADLKSRHTAAGAPRFVDERPSNWRAMNARRLVDAAVEIDRGDQRFVAVGEQRLFAAPAGLLFAAAEQQMVAETQPLGEPRERRRSKPATP